MPLSTDSRRSFSLLLAPRVFLYCLEQNCLNLTYQFTKPLGIVEVLLVFIKLFLIEQASYSLASYLPGPGDVWAMGFRSIALATAARLPAAKSPNRKRARDTQANR